MKKTIKWLISALMILQIAQAKDEHGKDERLKVGDDLAAISFQHDVKHGQISITVYEKDGKTIKKIADQPRLNVTDGKNRKQLKAKALKADEHGHAASFVFKDEILKKETQVVVMIKLAGKWHKVKGHHHHEGHDDHHGHDHGDHEGHGH